MADQPGGASGMLVRGYKGKEPDRLVTRIAPGVVSLVAELRGHERQAAEELSQWKTRVERMGGVIALTSQPFSRNRHLYRSRSFNSGSATSRE